MELQLREDEIWKENVHEEETSVMQYREMAGYYNRLETDKQQHTCVDKERYIQGERM